MKILVDENMPYVEPLFGDLGEIIPVNGRTLTAEQVRDADVLLVRSVTQVNAELLCTNHQLKFVGSATIGTDHVDLAYLTGRHIPFSNAPGCNAIAVGEFAFIAMLELAERFDSPLRGKVVGIVGAGNTGSATAKCLEAYGVKVLLNDPIKAAEGDPRSFVSLETIMAQADIISLHVPITRSGEHKTLHLFDESRLTSLKPNTWLLNCCRGDVIDNKALINVKRQRDDLKLVLDVWEGEPHPIPELVSLAEFATPHIAGYSLEGKARGTFMLYQALCQQLHIPATKSLTDLLPAFNIKAVELAVMPNEKALLQLARFVYDLRDDDRVFRNTFLNANGFDTMRKNHRHRREFSALALAYDGQLEVDWLSNLGFSGVGQ
ncbi:4-phosphoerythronate dehydrogenase [Shewanella sp. HN-41]|uniref:4-phosphoerythronate dehydrogenase n=1 Tax=Shewanella sp. HN-41 TaxID=327275 RepID=UPI0002125A70|nr:4-phosphoerythronate dehydrogenase [Shewanella sp. HN-41]EGM69486.1 erythronate-4-phosphate dehydrogenase [Shewanella sp. HN-41]